MDSCYSGDHIVRDQIHTDITTCNTEKPQQKYRLGMVSSTNRLRGREQELCVCVCVCVLGGGA